MALIKIYFTNHGKKKRKPDEKQTPQKEKIFRKKSNRQIMGKLLDDVIFLEILTKNPEFGKFSFDSNRD